MSLRAPGKDADGYQGYLLAFDPYRDFIQLVARRLIEAQGSGLDSVVVVSRVALDSAP